MQPIDLLVNFYGGLALSGVRESGIKSIEIVLRFLDRLNFKTLKI